MEMLRMGIAQSMLKRKKLPDVPMMTLLRENLLEGIRSRYPASNVIIAAVDLKAKMPCCNVMDLGTWLSIIPPRYRGIKIDGMIAQEQNLLLYTGRFLLEEEIMKMPIHLPDPNSEALPFHWLVLPYVRDHRHLKDSEAFLCMLVDISNPDKKVTKCAFEIFASEPHFFKKMVKQIALNWTYHGPKSINESIVNTGQDANANAQQALSVRPTVRDYSVLWVAPGLEVMNKVPELFSFMEEQQQYLIGELAKKIRRLMVVRHQVLSIEPDHPPADVRNAAFDALKGFFQQFDEKEYKNPTPLLDADNNFDYTARTTMPKTPAKVVAVVKVT